ncbi:hypothetical protein ABZ923_16835 [Streptomyces sp. NPDC046881]|uniref:hypothetical protein n=1 Tax=Streptomyces sp. NPDC046881 TaxID=3155374 RepID=UPI0033DB76B3
MNTFSQNGISLTELLGRGELLIVTTSLSAAAAGQIITRKGTGHENMLGFLVSLNILIAVVTAGLFAFVSSAAQTKLKIDADTVALYSTIFFIATIVTAGSSAFIVEWWQGDE